MARAGRSEQCRDPFTKQEMPHERRCFAHGPAGSAQKLAGFSLLSPFERRTHRTQGSDGGQNSGWMIEQQCPGPTSALVEMVLLAGISVDRLSELPQVK